MALEEENYKRIAQLLTGISQRAVRIKFDSEFSPVCLERTLRRAIKDLSDPKNKKNINQHQWNLLFPTTGKPESINFDVTLMILLLRHLTDIQPPSSGWDNLPNVSDTSIGADLARIKYYRNYLAHLPDSRINSSEFSDIWSCLSDAIKRLGGDELYDESIKLKTKCIDQSNQELMLDIKRANAEINVLKQQVQECEESHKSVLTLTQQVNEMMVYHQLFKKGQKGKLEESDSDVSSSNKCIKPDPVPWNIRELIETKLKDWKEENRDFVITRAAKSILTCVQNNRCVTITGSSGMGKTSILRHVVLKMAENGYDIIPIKDPCDIEKYYNPSSKTVFMVDDFCGTYSANKLEVDKWKTFIDHSSKYLNKNVKTIVACRLQVFQDDLFKSLSLFTSCVCNLLSEDFKYLNIELQSIADLYLKSEASKITDHMDMFNCFPLLCQLFKSNQSSDVKKFFQDPFSVYETEIDSMYSAGHYSKYCALALCVTFNNFLEEEILTGDIDKETRAIFKNLFEACKLNRGTPRAEIQSEIETLLNSYLRKEDKVYMAVHNKMFDFLSYYFSKKMLVCLIQNGSSKFIRERFVFVDTTESNEFLIKITPSNQDIYFKRMITDWMKGDVGDVFLNINMKYPKFRDQFLAFVNNLDVFAQHELAHTSDRLHTRTVLSLVCFSNDIEWTQWCIYHGLDINKCGEDGISPLFIASYYGHREIVNTLLDKKADINQCTTNIGASPLYVACQEGQTMIVKILLDKKADINQCTTDIGASPLFVACAKGQTEIVKILLDKKADINQCTTDIGASPLFVACAEGQTEIVKILLDKNADINHCTTNTGASPLFVACENSKK